MNLTFDDQVALITGAAMGVGLATVDGGFTTH